GDIRWQVPYGTVPRLVEQGITNTGVLSQRGGPVLTAGGLLFAATNDKKFRAYDADNGRVVWETTLPAGSEGVPAVYQLNGRQYIALCVAAGDGEGSYMVFGL